MPVDPKVLKQDFESRGSQYLPKLLELFGKIKNVDDFMPYESQIRFFTNYVWYTTNIGIGLNLRDREKILPVFEEYARVFKRYSAPPKVLYRGVLLPDVYKTLLTDNSNNLNNPEVIEVLKSLAYGVRSWSKTQSNSIGWSQRGSDQNDSVVFVEKNPDYVFDCDAYFSVMEDVLNEVDIDEYPFDFEEVVRFVQHPKIISINNIKKKTSLKGTKAHLWEVEIIS